MDLVNCPLHEVFPPAGKQLFRIVLTASRDHPSFVVFFLQMIEPVSFIRIREVIRRCWWYHFIFPRAALCVHARYTLLKRYEDARLTTDSPGPHIIAACLLDTRLKNTRCWLCMLPYYARQTLNQKNNEHWTSALRVSSTPYVFPAVFWLVH